MENMIQERVQRFLHRVEREHNLNEQTKPSIHMAPRALQHRALEDSSFNFVFGKPIITVGVWISVVQCQSRKRHRLRLYKQEAAIGVLFGKPIIKRVIESCFSFSNFNTTVGVLVSKSSQNNWRDDKIRREKGEETPSYDNFRKQRKEENVSRNTYKYINNNNYSNQNEFGRNLSKVKCYNCQKFGHFASNCNEPNHRGEESNLVQEDEEPTLLMAIKEDCLDYEKFSLDEKETNSSNYWFSLSKYFKNKEPEWIEWKERVIEEVLVPEKENENEYENSSSKLVSQAENKSDKDVVLCDNKRKLEEVCVVSPKCKPMKIQEVGVTQEKERGKQVKDEDTREGFKANKEYARDKDKYMKIKEDDIYHKGRKPKFRDNGG
ncbi:hypothetical protein E3N88_31649 [Mikania micrantha]|uniref:CCHC-type domain-containing protein n=1 Tax=Mikania micrantha TaxID=192012 RepID=A0A5N6M6A6_9ASTR|nr:hypothetical protein E3N88_31649 [Mikania micrantha]